MRIDSDGELPGAGRSEDAAKGTAELNRQGASAGRALITIDHEIGATAASPFSFRPTQGMVAAVVALVLGGGFMAGAALLGSKTTPAVAVAQTASAPDPTALLLQKVQDEIHTLKVSVDSMRATSENSRQDDAIRSLKRSVDVLKQDLEVAKASNAGAVAQLATKLDRLDRDPSSKLSEISARLDKLDRSDKDSNPKLAEIAARLDQFKTESGTGKLAEITARLDRIEKQVSSPATTASITPPPRPAVMAAPASTAAPATPSDPKAPFKPAVVDGWMLRDVYGGVALLEGRAGMRQVTEGQFVPGVGEIRSIERRGRAWVVVTSRGIIEADKNW